MNLLDVYTGLWIAAFVVAAILAFRRRHSITLFSGAYGHFLLTRWRLVTAAIGIAAMVVAGPFSNDPFWDPWNGLFMSVLTYLTAPWAIGTLYRALRRQASIVEAFVAACLALFSASWSFDLYWWVRSGEYPVVWDFNLLASGALYVAAGLFWNLEHDRHRGVVFAFMLSDWPRASTGASFRNIGWMALPFMLFAIVMNAIAFI